MKIGMMFGLNINKMIYEKIEGWFNYETFYDAVLQRFDNAVFVEIGAWKGKSIAYMAEKIKDSGKNIKFFAVDYFLGSPESEAHTNDPDIVNGTLYQTYLKNIEPLKDYVTTIKGDSKEVYNMFEDKSIDFLFIDGSHTYESVKKDIELWLPKVKHVISGHDYDWQSVAKAVDEIFPERRLWGMEGNYFIWIKEL
jgi:hypothetical protein